MSVDIDSAKLITKSSGGGGITYDGNKVLVTVDSATTKEGTSIPAGNYYHELQLTDGSGMKTVAAIGIVEFKTPSLKRT